MQKTSGRSTLGALTNSNYRIDIPVPGTAALNLIYMIKPDWALSATLRYNRWSVFQNLKFKNTVAGDFVVPQKYHNVFSEQLATRYQFNPSWAAFGAVTFDAGPQDTPQRLIGLPVYNVLFLAAGAEYNFTKELSAKLIYGHGMSNPKIYRPAVNQIGKVNIDVDLVDLSLTWKI